MSATPQHVQAQIDAAITNLQKVTSKYNPTGKYWKPALDDLAAARAEAGQLVAPAPPPPPSSPDPPVGAVPGPPVFLRTAGNATTQKLDVETSIDYGIGNMVWPPKPSTGVWTLQDCIAANVAAVPPRSRNGTAEAGFWIGQKTDAARLVARNCAWMGMWTGCMCDGSTISDFDLSGNPHVALYCEHITRNTTFDRFKIVHAGDSNAVNVEWWYTDGTYGPLLPYGGKAGSYGLTFQNFDITVPAGKWAFYLDAGTFGCTIKNGVIRGAGNGVNHPQNLVDPTYPNLIDWASIQFLASGTKEVVNQNVIG